MAVVPTRKNVKKHQPWIAWRTTIRAKKGEKFPPPEHTYDRIPRVRKNRKNMNTAEIQPGDRFVMVAQIVRPCENGEKFTLEDGKEHEIDNRGGYIFLVKVAGKEVLICADQMTDQEWLARKHMAIDLK